MVPQQTRLKVISIMTLRKFTGHFPKVANSAYIDPDAILIGRVTVGEEVTIWPGAVLRADDEEIIIEREAAILDNVTIEAPKGCPVRIGRGALISHAAIVHGATVEKGALVGINAIVLDGAKIGTKSLIGAGAVIPPGVIIPDSKLVLGIPAKIIRDITDEERKRIEEGVRVLKEKARTYKRSIED